MIFADACCNLTHESFRKDRAEVLARAQAAGVETIVVPGSSISDSEQAIKLSRETPDVLFATVGVHPHLANEWRAGSGEQLLSLARKNAFVAIGETGLDYYRNLSPPEQQLLAFREQLEIAQESDLPLLLHQRNAHEDFVSALRAVKIRTAVVHCFTGRREELEEYLELDLYIGITGWICDERRGQHLEELLAAIPANRLLLETDAPYLLPRNLAVEKRPRGRRNEPAFLVHTARHIAGVLDIPVEELARRTTANTRRLFRVDGKHPCGQET